MLDNPLALLRTTEDAAIAASEWVGTGDKLLADKAATEAMRARLNQIDFCAEVAIGEGKKDESYGLFHGEVVGQQKGTKPQYALAVDPIDGTRPTVTGGPEALSVLAMAEMSALLATEHVYMMKMAYGPALGQAQLHVLDPLSRTVEKMEKALGKPARNIVVCLLDRPRHEEMIAAFRQLGVRIKLIQDGDVSGAISTCMRSSNVDLLYGVGGAPEGVIAAAALKCLGGGIQGQMMHPDGVEAVDDAILSTEDMVQGDCAFVATGITQGGMLQGVKFTSQGLVTQSVAMRSESKTVRWVTTRHGA